jgi:hypothetical protein
LAELATTTLSTDLGGVGGVINSGFVSGGKADGVSLMDWGLAGVVNAVSDVNSILDTGVVSGWEMSLSETGERLGGLVNDEAGGMGERGLTTAVFAEFAELGSAIALGGLRACIAPTLPDAGGVFSRIVGLVTARIWGLAVRTSGSFGFAVANFLSEVLESAVL